MISLPSPRQSRIDWFLSALLLTLSLVAMVTVAHDLLTHGPFAWHISQPSTIEGGIEALLLTGLLVLAAGVNRRWGYIIVGVFGLLYLRRHNAELALFSGVLYVEFLLAGGYLIGRALGQRGPDADTLLPQFLLGLSAWLLVSLLLSLAWLGTGENLLAVLLVLGTLALLASRRAPASLRLGRAVCARPLAERCVFALLVAWTLVLAARTANVVGHDTLWYLAQGDRVLAPNGSLFENLGLSSPVHYFPKLWETLLLPLTTLDQLRPQEGLGIAALMLLMFAVWHLCQALGMRPLWRWWTLWLLATLPAIANTALSLKTDTLCVMLICTLCLYLFFWLRQHDNSALLYALAAGALACSGKLTAIPYVGLLFIVAFAIAAVAYARRDQSRAYFVRPSLSAWVTAGLALIATLLLLARTWWLTGVPTIGPDPLVSLWRVFGMEISEPVGTLNWTRPQEWSEVPRLFYEWLLAPSYMFSIRISWIGNFWAVFAIAALIAAVFGYKTRYHLPSLKERGLMLAVCAMGLTLALVWRYYSRGGDGNYFMFPIIMASILAVLTLAARLVDLKRSCAALAIAACGFGFFHATYSFISTAWSPTGTRTWDLNFTQPPLQPGAWRRVQTKRAGVEQIHTYLETRPHDERLLSFRLTQATTSLPVRVEDLDTMAMVRPEYFSDTEALFQHMERYRIRHLLLTNKPDNKRAVALAQKAEALGWIALPDQKATLYSDPRIETPAL